MAMFGSGRSIAGTPERGDLVHVKARHDLHEAERALFARRDRIEARLHGNHREDQRRIEPVALPFAKRGAHDLDGRALGHAIAARDDARELVRARRALGRGDGDGSRGGRHAGGDRPAVGRGRRVMASRVGCRRGHQGRGQEARQVEGKAGPESVRRRHRWRDAGGCVGRNNVIGVLLWGSPNPRRPPVTRGRQFAGVGPQDSSSLPPWRHTF